MRTQQQAERAEQQRIKNLVLNYDLRDDDANDGGFNDLLQPNTNRSRPITEQKRIHVSSRHNSELGESTQSAEFNNLPTNNTVPPPSSGHEDLSPHGMYFPALPTPRRPEKRTTSTAYRAPAAASSSPGLPNGNYVTTKPSLLSYTSLVAQARKSGPRNSENPKPVTAGVGRAPPAQSKSDHNARTITPSFPPKAVDVSATTTSTTIRAQADESSSLGKATLELQSPYSQPRIDKAGPGRNQQRARKLQLSDVDWYVLSTSILRVFLLCGIVVK